MTHHVAKERLRRLALTAILLAGCGAYATRQTPALGHTDTAGARAIAMPPAFVAQPLLDGDVACDSADDCEQVELCMSPERASWNACGAPMPAVCSMGWPGDACGSCFQGCETGADSPKSACSAGMCVSAQRCVPDMRPLP